MQSRRLNFQAAFQNGPLREEEESPAAITRGESCYGETDETPFF